METLLQYFIEYRYLVIFFGTFIEGEVVLIAGGFLVCEGYLNFALLILIATLAAIVGDNFFSGWGADRELEPNIPWPPVFLTSSGSTGYLREKSLSGAMVENRSLLFVSSTASVSRAP